MAWCVAIGFQIALVLGVCARGSAPLSAFFLAEERRFSGGERKLLQATKIWKTKRHTKKGCK